MQNRFNEHNGTALKSQLKFTLSLLMWAAILLAVYAALTRA